MSRPRLHFQSPKHPCILTAPAARNNTKVNQRPQCVTGTIEFGGMPSVAVPYDTEPPLQPLDEPHSLALKFTSLYGINHGSARQCHLGRSATIRDVKLTPVQSKLVTWCFTPSTVISGRDTFCHHTINAKNAYALKLVYIQI